MECIYNVDWFCTNDQCPICADYCPVSDTKGVCKYEEREEERWVLTPKGCLAAALNSNDIYIADDFFNAVWKDFTNLMSKFGYMEEN